MTRLPTPGGDTGQWGGILNQFLGTSHNTDGSLKTAALQQAGGVTSVNGVNPTSGNVTITANSIGAYAKPSSGIPASDLSAAVQSDLSANANAVQIGGDLSGTPTSPTVTKVNGISVSGTPSAGQVITASSSTAASWTVPASAPVSSVAGKTGVVTLAESDITNLATDLGNLVPKATTVNGHALSGNVTVTSGDVGAIPTSTATTKGDILAATAASTLTRVGVGSDTQVLTADSTQASGVKWASVPAASNATTSSTGVVQLSGDLAGTATSPQVTSTHLASAMPVNQGGTGSITQNFVDLSTSQTVAGGKNFTDRSSASNVALRASSTDQIIYVSTSANANDSNDGLSWGTAKATVAGALTALGSLSGIIQLGHGVWTISSADTNGNAITLPHGGTVLRGMGKNNSYISITTTVTWGIMAQAALCQVEELSVEITGSGTCTYGVGIDIPSYPGSAGGCMFKQVNVLNVTTGSLVNAFAVGPTFTGGGVDIAGTSFISCSAEGFGTNGATGAGFLLGSTGGAGGNVLNTHFFDCGVVLCKYGVAAYNVNFTWLGGDFGENGTDLYIRGLPAATVVQGSRSEVSQCFLDAAGSSASSNLMSIRDFNWDTFAPGAASYSQSTGMVATGNVINWNMGGTLKLDNVQVRPVLSSTNPVAVIGTGGGSSGYTEVIATNITSTSPAHQFFSSPPLANVSVTLTGYQQIDTNTLQPTAIVPGQMVLTGTSNAFVTGSSGYDAMQPIEQITLSSNGAVAISGVAQIAKVTLQANATSTTVTKLYMGQKLTITYVQDATGSRTYVWPAICKFTGGVTPTAQTAANAVDSATFYYDGTSLIQISPNSGSGGGATLGANTFTGNQTAPALVSSGLTGATSASRYVGATASGAPASGTFSTGDFVIDQTGKVWICTAGGTPGTWTIATKPTDVQWFPTVGTATWTKPAGAVSVEAFVLSGGAGGGSGRRGAAGTVRCGGGGGAGATLVQRQFAAADLSSSVTVTVGDGGAGGAAVTTDDTNGNAGSFAGISSFGTYVAGPIFVTGAGGTTTGGAGGTGILGLGFGGSGGSASATGGVGGTVNAGNLGATGGPAGGGITSGDVANNGAAGSYSFLGGSSSSTFGTAGVVDTTAPTSGTSSGVKGTPGGSPGSGAASITTAAQAGASAYANSGAGGAGGGASLDGNNSGAGGKGGSGFVLVISHFS